jgi:signal transduction histidine kinase
MEQGGMGMVGGRPDSAEKINFTSIRNKIMFWFLIAGILPLIIAFSLSYFAGRQILENHIIQGLTQSLEERVNDINEFIYDKKDDLEIFTRLYSIVDAVSGLENIYKKYGGSSGAIKRARFELKKKFEYFAGDNEYTGLHLMDLQGNMLFSMSGKNMDAAAINGPPGKTEPDLKAVFDRVKNSGNAGFSQFHYSDVLKKNIMFVAAPVHAANGALTGIMALEINEKDIHKLAANYIGLEKTGDTVIATRKGNEVVFLTDIRDEPGGALKRKLIIGAKLGMPIQNAVLGKSGSGLAIDYRGLPVLAVWRYIPELDWGIEVKIQANEAFRSLDNLRFILFLVLLVSIIMSFAGTVWVARRISGPITNLTSAANDVAAGRTTKTIKVESNDELGILAGAFNKMERDINEAIGSLNKKADELQRANTDLEQFFYMSSHDLQEPLRTIDGYLQMIKHRAKDKLDPETVEFIDVSVAAARGMTALIRDLLEYSRVGKTAAKKSNVKFKEVIDAACFNLKGAIESSGASVTCGGEMPAVNADFSLMVSLMQNLISNAIKYRGTAPPVVEITAEQKDGYYFFMVKDNGIGIDPKYFEKLFIVFQRLYTRDEYEGTGVGLAICKKIVEQHNGKIWVESEPGKGARFYFSLPV